ncbi:OppA family ABC transporter substrate-binding lipoprotein [Mycoplasma crocodyli]|uniref:Putative lipoprotein n=1 Tax=Mycoplasma crocodyli (strain ATCC 51981 / MP145) TaxID=512564 RepID=D5E599_MYCCM|nr:hypothetical protein [Mycoplasma crocodyli]ADE19997.1 putative lipoprotein [Mycoplasma crocodyli MP145]
MNKKQVLRNFLLTSTIACASSSMFFVSCSNPGKTRKIDQYIKSFNYPNTLKSNNYAFSENKIIENDTENLVFAPLLSYEYKDKVIYDYVNSSISVPTKKILRLNLLKDIEVFWDEINIKTNKLEEKKQIYNSDDYNLSLTKPDIGINYSTPIITVESLSTQSINHRMFLNNIKRSKRVKFNLKDSIFYSDSNGNLTSYKLLAKDFLVGINQQKNSESWKKIKNSYGVDLSDQNNSLIMNNNKNLLDFFISEQLIKNLMFNPISTLKISETNSTFDSYSPTLKEALWISDYILNKNELNKQIFIKNFNSPNKSFAESNNNLSKIILNFNSISIDNETYRLQAFKSFRQNLLSEVDYDIFNSLQQKEINNFPDAYGLTLQLNNSSLTSNINSQYNLHFDKSKKYDFNNAASLLIYDTALKDLSNNYDISNFTNNKFSFLFRNYLKGLINYSGILNIINHKNYWNNIALPTLIMNGKDNEYSSYKSANDAHIWVNKDTQFLYNSSEKIITTDFDFEKNINSLESLINNIEKIKSPNFLIIKKQLDLLIEDFYIHYNLAQDQRIELTIPLFSQSNDFNNLATKSLNNLFKTINKKLIVTFKLADDSYIKFNNSLVSKVNYSYISNSIDSYLELICNNELLCNSLFNFNLFSLEQYKKFKEYFLDRSNLTYQKVANNEKNKRELISSLKTFFKTLTNFEQVEFINELSLISTSPISLNVINTSSSFKKVIVNNKLEKPLNDLGFNRFQDIKIY